MSADERTLKERVDAYLYSVMGLAVVDWELTNLLREQQARIAELERDLEAARVELADRREHMRRGMRGGVNARTKVARFDNDDARAHSEEFRDD